MSAWVTAFRKYAADIFGDRYKYAELDPDYLHDIKGGFRAGYRAGAGDRGRAQIALRVAMFLGAELAIQYGFLVHILLGMPERMKALERKQADHLSQLAALELKAGITAPEQDRPA